MRYCNKCKVRVAGSTPHCPLCQGELPGRAEKDGDVFPPIPLHSSRFWGLIAFIAFCSAAAAAVSVAVNISIPQSGWWYPFVIAGIISLWISFLLIYKKRKNIPKSILLQVFFLPLVVLLWDFFMGFHKWSVNFVIPILFSCAMVGMAAFARIRRLRGGDYIIYLGVVSLFSVLSLLLILFDVVTVVYPSAACFGLSIISLAYLIFVEGKSLSAEIKRRMHL